MTCCVLCLFRRRGGRRCCLVCASSTHWYKNGACLVLSAGTLHMSSTRVILGSACVRCRLLLCFFHVNIIVIIFVFVVTKPVLIIVRFYYILKCSAVWVCPALRLGPVCEILKSLLRTFIQPPALPRNGYLFYFQCLQ